MNVLITILTSKNMRLEPVALSKSIVETNIEATIKYTHLNENRREIPLCLESLAMFYMGVVSDCIIYIFGLIGYH